MAEDGRLVFDTGVDLRGLQSGLQQAQSQTDSMSNTASMALGSLAAQAAAQVTTAVTTAFKEAGQFIVDTGSQFEAAMSQVGATMGITAASEEYSRLTEAAKAMGAATKFSASEAADALNYLALAGYNAEQSIAALPTVLNVAAAGGIDLAYASDMITDSMSALGLEMDELDGFADRLAVTSQKSNTSVAQLGEAILTVGGTAKSLSGGVDELNTMLGLIADNGVKGAEGGTALRNIILSLSAPTDTAKDALKKLNVEAFDSQGNLRELSDVFADFNTALEPLTQQERTQFLNDIFNKVDLKTVNALLGTFSERFDELRGYIEDCDGAAAQMAETMSDNLQGDIAIFNSTLEAVGNTAYESIAGTLRTSVQSVTDVLSRLNTALDGELGDRLETVAVKLGDIAVTAAEFAVDRGIPMLIDGLEWVIDHDDELITAAETAGAMVIAYKGLSAAASVSTAVQGLTTSLTAATTVQEGFNIVLGACPWVAVGTAIIGAEIALASWIDKQREMIGYEGEIKEAFNEANKEIAIQNGLLSEMANSSEIDQKKQAYEQAKRDVEEYTRMYKENEKRLFEIPDELLEAEKNGNKDLEDRLSQEMDGLLEQNTFLENALIGRKKIVEKYSSVFDSSLTGAMSSNAEEEARRRSMLHFGVDPDAVTKAEQQTAAAIVTQEEMNKQLADNWAELDHKYSIGLLADEKALYNARLALLSQYGNESSTEHWKYYEQIYTYEKKAHEEELAEQKKHDAETAKQLETNLGTVSSLYQQQYNALLEQQKSYRQRLMAIGGSVFSVEETTDKNGQKTKTFKVNDVEKQIADMKAYHEDIMKLKNDGASSALLSELNSMPADDAMQMADYVANMSKAEREKIIELYKQKEAVADELSAEMYYREAETLQNTFAAAITDLGIDSYEAGTAAAEQFASGFNGKLSDLIGASSNTALYPIISAASAGVTGGAAALPPSQQAVNVNVQVTGGKLEMDGKAVGKYTLDYQQRTNVQKG